MNRFSFISGLFSALIFSAIISCSSENKDETTDAPADSTAASVNDTVSTDTIKVHGHLEFPSEDGLMITADSYEIVPGEKYVLLCHQAGFSRGEYTETAKRFNALGYNCLAIDQRSGEECNGVINETAKRAKEKGMKPEYLDAEQDIVASIKYIYNHSGHKVILLGSSYSASLVLKIAKTNEMVEAVAAFSPGEYFNGMELKKEIEGLTIPVFATSSKDESKDLATLMAGVKSPIKEVFVPTDKGDHGSRVLWNDSPSNDEYWKALISFLKSVQQSI